MRREKSIASLIGIWQVELFSLGGNVINPTIYEGTELSYEVIAVIRCLHSTEHRPCVLEEPTVCAINVGSTFDLNVNIPGGEATVKRCEGCRDVAGIRLTITRY